MKLYLACAILPECDLACMGSIKRYLTNNLLLQL